MASSKWIDHARALYRRNRGNSEVPAGWFDDRLWSDCVRAAKIAVRRRGFPGKVRH